MMDAQMPEAALMAADTVRYELDRLHARAYFSPEVLHNIKAEWIMDDAMRHVAVEVVALVATWREQRLLEVPANWWEHFKERWFPAWALKRWPVLTKVYDAAVILPRVPIVSPDYHMVEFAVWRDAR
jgi:hypothetical protein